MGPSVFEEEDLTDEVFVILCLRKNEEEGIERDTAFFWKGYNFDASEHREEGEKMAKSEEDFKEKVFREYWGPEYKQVDIEEREEEVGEESDEFFAYFD